MNVSAQLPAPDLDYPESDGQPMGDSTLQIRWIFTLFGNIDALFHDRVDIFVAANLFWYPVEGKPRIVTAPDVMVAFGRPKGERRVYKQWEEGGKAPQVVFEVLSHTNTVAEMEEKRLWYQRETALRNSLMPQ